MLERTFPPGQNLYQIPHKVAEAPKDASPDIINLVTPSTGAVPKRPIRRARRRPNM